MKSLAWGLRRVLWHIYPSQLLKNCAGKMRVCKISWIAFVSSALLLLLCQKMVNYKRIVNKRSVEYVEILKNNAQIRVQFERVLGGSTEHRISMAWRRQMPVSPSSGSCLL